jgi:Flp pilus assembly protein TadG
MMRSIKKWFLREHGQSIILVTIALAMLCGVVALVVDVGRVSVTQGQLQNAADAAGLAAARELPSASAASTAAKKYAVYNGVLAANTTVTTPYKSNANRVEVVCKQTVDYTFAKVIGLNSTQVSARAVAEKSGGGGGAFGYAVFSGGNNLQLGMYSSSLNITGSVHSNYSLLITGSSQTITGNAEAVTSLSCYVSSITIGGLAQGASIDIQGSTINVPNRLVSPSSVISMPDFSAEVKTEATAAGTSTKGDKTFYGTNFNVDNSFYVDGKVQVAASTFSGQGTICATKDINMSGSMLKANSGTAVCLYSTGGSINLSTSSLNIYGTLYAPNGSVNIYASNINVYGRVVAKSVLITGSNVNIISGSNDLGFLSGGTFALVE